MANERDAIVTRLRPQHQLIITFFVLILTGSVVLTLPGMTTQGGISYVDALFTATSAVCVTGLIVKDTGDDFTRLGQWVLLILIQLGGLGIMCFSTLLLLLLGKRPSLTQDTVLENTFVYSPMKNLHKLILVILLFTFLAEFLGTLAFFVHWVKILPIGEALFTSLFHAVSAFCNAGFCLFSDSFIAYHDSWLLNTNSIILITAGGIGFVVLLEIFHLFAHGHQADDTRRRLVSLHTKLTVLTTVVLLAAGAIFFFVLEYGNALNGMDLLTKGLVSLFQSVTARTAGFNTIDFGQLSNATLFFFVFLMFIGASPGSCGGGIKTTTAAVFFAIVRSHLRGQRHTTVMSRAIPQGTIARTVGVVISSALVIGFALVLLLVVQLGNSAHTETGNTFLEYLFETVSAFGTVGLSMGATEKLTGAGKLLIIAVMFIGRLGPLTLAFSLRPSQTEERFHYTEENVMIG